MIRVPTVLCDCRRSRLLVVIFHFGVWMFDDMTYPSFTSPDLAQRVWVLSRDKTPTGTCHSSPAPHEVASPLSRPQRWITWSMSEMTLLLTALVIALAVEKGQRAQASTPNAIFAAAGQLLRVSCCVAAVTSALLCYALCECVCPLSHLTLYRRSPRARRLSERREVEQANFRLRIAQA